MTLKKTREQLKYGTLTEAECAETVDLAEALARTAEQAEASEFQLMVAAVTLVMVSSALNEQNPETVAQVLGVVNLILRFFTSQAVGPRDNMI
jgi:hypothetical protein